jgi:hypothetical protein
MLQRANISIDQGQDNNGGDGGDCKHSILSSALRTDSHKS